MKNEIEVTHEMVVAGVREFVAYDSRFDDPEDAVKEIFAAMLREHAQHSRQERDRV